MRIAIAIKEFTLRKGGAERYAVNIARQFARMGIDVHIFSSYCDNIEDKNITYHRVPIIRKPSILKIISFPLLCRSIIAQNNYDLTYALTPVFPVDVYRIGEGLHIDVLRYRYGSGRIKISKLLSPRHLAILSIERRLFKKGNYKRIVCNSRMLMERTIFNYSVPRENISVIYNGVDQERFNPDVKIFRSEMRRLMDLKEDDLVILFVSNDFYRKGLKKAIEALSDFNVLFSGGWKLVVVGRDRAEPYMRLAKKGGIKDRIVFLGMRDDIEKFYGMADILLLPTLYDPFANVVAESIACGTPVITTRINGASEIVEDGKTGILIEGNRNEIVDALFSVSRKERREIMSKNCENAGKNFSINEHCKILIQLFSEILLDK
ncbi:MAG: glycosyltransferase family 4 protein [Candidatus Aenigmatarchaeota archaeon]